MCAALRSLDLEDRELIERDLAKTIADRERYQHHLARLTMERAPHSYRGKLRAQIRACVRGEKRMQQLLDEDVAA